MKYYETHFEEYVHSVNTYNLHEELIGVYECLPNDISKLGNMIVYGSSGIGKYSQVLKFLQKYSPSMLKYEKKIKVQNEKHSYTYKISDIHYEIDMSLLGCNSKNFWHEIFMQITDIISMKNEKKGIIVCKNFHTIHTELLEIFYSYMQQYNHPSTHIQIRFLLVTEHVSFLPNNILDNCKIISIRRPSKEKYLRIAQHTLTMDAKDGKPRCFMESVMPPLPPPLLSVASFSHPHQRLITDTNGGENVEKMLKDIDIENIMNTKELRSLALITNKDEIPKDVFNIICNNIIHEMENYNEIEFTQFRDTIYDILTYNLDIYDCIWYILVYFIRKKAMGEKELSDICERTFLFFKYYNNNYRPIYHLESMFFYMINKIHGLHE